MVKYMAANDVYIGWTAWAAGPFWGPYSACCADSLQWGSLEPGSTAVDGSPGMYETVWLAEIQPLLPSTLVRSGISSLNPKGVSGGSLSWSSSKVVSSTSMSSSSSSKILSSTSTSVSKSSMTTSTKVSSTSAVATGVPLWGQCGGTGWSGPTACAVGTCKFSNPWYSQCLN